ncbi:MAG: hypothetical protein AAB337_01895 [Patescibacteria group bacterium]
MNLKNQQGISLIEGLVIAGIIGLMGTLAAVALNSAREQARDAKRLADVTRMQASLELYFNDLNSYPVVEQATALGESGASCLGGEGFATNCDKSAETVFMDPVPSTPEAGLKELIGCSGITNAYCYVGNADTYKIQFELENENPEAGLQKGANCATESNVKAGACE